MPEPTITPTHLLEAKGAPPLVSCLPSGAGRSCRPWSEAGRVLHTGLVEVQHAGAVAPSTPRVSQAEYLGIDHTFLAESS